MIYKGDVRISKVFNIPFKYSYVLALYLVLNLYVPFTLGQNIRNSNNPEIGQPFMQYFSSKVYNALPDNWTIAQDKRGIMYFGNESGILEYDGNSWRKIQVPNNASVRSLAVSKDGTVYVCAFGDFGYLEPDSSGRLAFSSLKPLLDKNYRNFGEMWDVITLANDVFFKTKDKIFKWNGNRITVIDSAFAYRLYKIGDRIYTRSQDEGLLEVTGDSLTLMPDGAFFADMGVYNMLPFKDKDTGIREKILITTNYSGLFLHDGRKFHPFKTEVDSFLMKNQVYNACRLSDGNFAFATQRGGAVIIDPKGRLVRFMNENSGLPTNVIYDVLAGRNGGLWLATNNGIIYCETPSPFSIFQNRGALKDRSNSVLRFKDTIYAVNDLGVLYLSERHSTFQLVEGSNKPAYELFDAGGTLLAGTNWGLVIVENNRIKSFIYEHQSAKLLASKIYPGRIYAGVNDGLIVIQKQKNKHFRVTYTFMAAEEVNSIVEEENGDLWIGGYFLGLYHVTGNLKKLSTGNDDGVSFKYYDKLNKLPGNEWNIFGIQGRMLLATDKGTFAFNNETQEFLPDSTLGSNLSGPQNTVSLIEKSTNGSLWILSKQNGKSALGKAVLQKDSRYKWKPLPELNRIDLNTTVSIYVDIDPDSKKEILWISTDEGLVRYDPEILKNIQADYLTLIRKVSVHNDSVIYEGNAAKKNSKTIILPFSENDLSFDFAALSFDKPQGILFQHFLEGNDEKWSGWSHESSKGYTNLSGGDYTFRVRSKNVYDITGKEDAFSFTVLPPWYFSWWAYSLYVILFLLVVFIVDRIQRSRVIEKERERANLREAGLIKKQAEELETIYNIVRVVNKEMALESLLQVLLKQGMKLFPQSENGAVLIYSQQTDDLRFAATIGYDSKSVADMSFTTEEITDRYAEGAVEVEKGVFLVKQFRNTENVDKFRILPVPKSLILMSATWDGKLEGIVVFASLSKTDAFDRSDARKLRRFREHTISAIAKARILKELQDKNEKIIKTQQQLVIQEKLASLGQLTAGIAHEIKNPLNFVNNFSEVSVELMEELHHSLETQKEKLDDSEWENIESIIETLQSNSKRIKEHGKRADDIVRSMLLHSRGKSGEWQETDINAMLDESLNLAYHGMRAKNVSFNITLEKDFDHSIGNVKVVPQNLNRVFLNIIQNGFFAATSEHKGKSKTKTLGGAHEPRLSIKTRDLKDKIEIRFRDNGPGIPEKIKDKIFTPFYSTKPSGEGTGLGLSIAYDIVVKEHNGEINFETEEGTFTEFIITIPKV